MSEWPRSWRDLPMGGLINSPATSLRNFTGSWRSQKPIIDLEKCIKCLICWIDCPDNSIVRLHDDYVEVDYKYCKGCGICAAVCPTKAIMMIEEGD